VTGTGQDDECNGLITTVTFVAMENTTELARYVVRYHPHLMTESERCAERHLVATMKATRGNSDLKAQYDARSNRQLSRWLSNDPEVLSLAANGYQAFVERAASRILNEERTRVCLNRCPECGGLARTPSAKQCRFCGHDWHR
jgi:hypothetical protein